RLWDVATGRLLLEIDSGDFGAGVAFSPDGRRLAIGNYPAFELGSVSVWELQNGRGIPTLRGLSGQIAKTALSPDGLQIAALAHDWHVAIWEVGTGHLRAVLEAPQGMVADNSALAFSADGHQFAFATGSPAGGEAVL